MEMTMEFILEVASKGLVAGIGIGSITILSGWGIRQLMIFFKNIIL